MAGRWPYRVLIALGAAGLATYAVAVLALEEFRPQNLAWGLVFLAPLYGIGVLAYSRRSDLPIAKILVLGGSTYAAFSGVLHVTYASVDRDVATGVLVLGAVLSLALGGVSAATGATLFALYPDGRFQRRYERWLVGTVWMAMSVGVLAYVFLSPTLPLDVEYGERTIANPLAVPGLPALDSFGSDVGGVLSNLAPGIVILLGMRYRRSSVQARQQIRWLLLIPICALALAALGYLLEWAEVDSAWFIAGTVGQYVYLGLVPGVLFVSITRHRLLDVDVIIRKSLVYGALWALIAALYIGSAAAIGIAGSQRLPVAVAVLLTVVAMVGFQPLRRRLEATADRWVFGRRLRGYALLEHLGGQLEVAGDQTELMARLADAVRSGLRLRWARVVIDGAVADQSGERPPGEPPAQVTPLEHAGELVGAIECGPKVDGSGVGNDDRHVLATVGRQAALAVHNTRLASRIVATADAERRRIERDLHDGAQQQVVALLVKLRLARNHLRREPSRAEATFAELETELAALHRDLIELTRGIHPPVLSDRGLAEAIRSRTERLPLRVRVEVDEPVEGSRFADEIEGAAYFVCSEALTNVMKHSRASSAVVELAAQDGRLRVRVCDDGVGFNGANARRGSGLANLADRLAALDGVLSVESTRGVGTTVCATLPARQRDQG